MKLKRYIRLLALVYTPATGKSILDWTPFEGGDTLDKIITNHNVRCIEGYQRLRWLPEFIEDLVEGIDIVPHDLSTVDKLRIWDFASIRIIMVDLNAIWEQTKIEQIKVRMSKHDQYYFLAQVSRSPSIMSRITDFQPLPVKPSTPEIIVDQTTFEEWLSRFCEGYCTTITSMPPPTGDLSTIQAYIKALPEVAAKVRDAAIIRDLSEEEIVTLAHQAAMQEFTLARIAGQVRTRTKRRVVLDAIRMPIDRIAIESFLQQTPTLQRVKLVEVSLERPMSELTTEQRNIVVGLNIKRKTDAAVHLDQPSILDRVSSLRGVVKVTKFTAMLPVGLKGKGG
ncbi:MAG: hypothetical protein AB1606_02460 [Nitrospirota bacterium]